MSILLYDGGGASVTEVFGPALEAEEWVELKQAVIRLLHARNVSEAAEFLVRYPFELRSGTNYFSDEFSVLYARVPLDTYVELAELRTMPAAKAHFKTIAETISEVGPFTRFTLVEMDTADGGPKPVRPPSPRVTSEAVSAALDDAEQLIAARGAASAVDRVHTALHGYLRAVLERQGIPVERGWAITRLFKELRNGHPKLKDLGHQEGSIFRVLMGMATVMDALNTIRNDASLAHPNEDRLQEPEAMLVVNAARTLLHYLDERTVYG